MGLRENLKELKMVRRLLAVSRQGGAFGEEVRRARQQRRMTLEALSQATGMAKSYLSQIETGYASPPRDEKIRKIAEALGLDAKALLPRARLSELPEDAKVRMARMFDATEEVIRALLAAKAGVQGALPQKGKPGGAAEPTHGGPGAPGDEARLPAGGQAPTEEEAGVALDLDALHRSGLLHHLAEWGETRREDRGSRLRAIPIINKVSAGYPQDFTDLEYPVGIADEYVSVPEEMADPNAFAVRVVGDSMEPKYHEGDVVVFMPSAPVESGDDCFVRFAVTGGPVDGESTFKRVFFDTDGRIRLQPLNERRAPTFVERREIQGMFRAAARYEKL